MHTDRRNILAAVGVGAVLLPVMGRAATLRPTPLETLGPFYPVTRPGDQDADLTRLAGRDGQAKGEVIELSGRVLAGDGSPVPGAILDLWQANAAGRYDSPLDANTLPLDPDFQGSAKLTTGADGRWRIVTVLPGAYPIGGGNFRTRHIHWDIHGPHGRLPTQSYFPGEELNEKDILLGPMLSGNREDASALMAKAAGKRGDGVARFEWDVVLLSPIRRG